MNNKTRLQVIIIDSLNDEISSFVHSEFLSILSIPFTFVLYQATIAVLHLLQL